jgi:hypothetical protein
MNSLLKKIKFKIKEHWATFLIKFGLFLNSPFVVALGLTASASVIGKKGKYCVLAMGRSIFTDDLKAMVEFSGQIKYYVIHLGYWEFIFNHFSTAEERKGLEEVNYHTADICAIGKKRYYEFLKKVFPYLINMMPVQACLTGNIMYVVQQELSKVCEENNVPYIVLHKEAIVLPHVYDNFISTYKNCKFFGSKILFYNQRCLEGFLKLNIDGLTEDKVELVGIPRLDYCFSEAGKRQSGSKKQVTFFSFLPRFSFRFLIKDENTLAQTDDRGKEFIKWVLDFALKHKDYNVIIKTKAAAQYLDYPKQVLIDNFTEYIDNLTITNAAEVSRLIGDSSVVMGFNSTTMLEAIIANKLIISPFFGDIIANQPWSFFDENPSLIKYAKNFDELENFILSNDTNFKYNEDVKNDFLEKYISTSAGNASKRAEQEVIKEINNIHKQKI